MNNNFKDESQKYLDEMMRLYSLGKSASVNTTAEPFGEVPKPPQENRPSEDILDEEENEPQNKPEPVPRPYPSEPIRPETPPDPPMTNRPVQENKPDMPGASRPQKPPRPVAPVPRPQPVIPPKPQPPQTEYGFMKIEVRTGENGIPVPDASVTVARKLGESEELVFSGTTNSSGAIEKLKLPAPANARNSDPGSFGNYAVYNVNVYYKGFYRESAQNVPVFSGITTIQRFNLVPLPFNMKDDGQEIVVTSEEPSI